MNKEELEGVANDITSDLESAISEIEDAVSDLESSDFEIDTVGESDEIADPCWAAHLFGNAAIGLESAVSTIESAIVRLSTAESEILPSGFDKDGAFKGPIINSLKRNTLNAYLRMCEMDLKLGEYDSALSTLERIKHHFNLIVEEIEAAVSEGRERQS